MLASDIIQYIAFDLFVPELLGVLALCLVAIYFWKRAHYEILIHRGPAGYAVKGVVWLVFGLSFLAFPFLPLIEARALLRISSAMLIMSSLAYEWYYIVLIAAGFVKWTQKQLML